MSLWADKYRPKTLEELTYHEDISKKLSKLAETGDFPHLLVYGPSGAGKKTRVMALLRELYGSGAEKLKVDVQTFQTPSGRKLEFNVISSPYHLEITPSDMGNNDRIVIQDLLKEVGQVESLDFAGILKNKSGSESGSGSVTAPTNRKKFKIVVINEAEQLSRDAQAALRRTMEKFSANIRLVLVCNSTSSIIDPIKSRTLAVRVGLPTEQEMYDAFEKVLDREHVARKSFPEDVAERQQVYHKICEASERNLRMALMMLEALYMNNERITAETEMVKPDWELVIDGLAQGIVKDRSVAKLQTTRSVLYELLAHAVPSKLILRRLVFDLWNRIPQEAARQKMVAAGALFDERLSLGSKDVFHLEGFVTRVMVVLETQ